MAVPRNVWASTRQHVFKYRRQEFFAENGLIHVIDRDDGRYSCVSVVDFLHRARAFNKEAARMARKKMWADERDELSRMVQDMIVCCDQARRQGDPFDPQTMRRMVAHRRSNRMVVPEGIDLTISAAAPSAPAPRPSRIAVVGRPDPVLGQAIELK
jgi:hypothetical protein